MHTMNTIISVLKLCHINSNTRKFSTQSLFVVVTPTLTIKHSKGVMTFILKSLNCLCGICKSRESLANRDTCHNETTREKEGVV